MFRSWVEAGQRPDLFGAPSPREMVIILEAAALRDARVAWSAAQYVRFAVHEPNNMPPQPGAGGAVGKVDPEVAEEMNRIRLQARLDADARKQKRNGS